MTGKRELFRVEANGQQRPIAVDVRKTGYHKIAQLVEMSLEADLTSVEKERINEKPNKKIEENKDSEEEEDDYNALDKTINPQSKV